MDPYPASPEPAHDPNDKGAAPASVQTAVKLIWVGVALSLVSAVLSFLLLDDLVDQALDNANVANASESAARAGAIGGIVISVIIGVALAALFAHFIGKGANWARIVWTVLSVLGLLFGLIGIANLPALFLVINVVSYALTIATLYFLYRPESNAFFKARPLV